MKQNSEYRAQARAALEGRWTEAVLMFLVLILVACAFSVPFGLVSGVYATRLPWLAESMSGCSFLVSVLIIMPIGYGWSNALLSFGSDNPSKWGLQQHIVYKTLIIIYLCHFFRTNFEH